jgi:P-type Ca2+ transporter type 2C
MNQVWHAVAYDQLAAELGSDIARGLTAAEAATRLISHGPNDIRKARRDSPLLMFFRQFESVVIWLLIVAAAVSVAMGEHL